jgi:hypothetical protein
VHVLDLTGKRIKSYKPHQASVSDMEFDITADFVATASIDGMSSLSSAAQFQHPMIRTGRYSIFVNPGVIHV